MFSVLVLQSNNRARTLKNNTAGRLADRNAGICVYFEKTVHIASHSIAKWEMGFLA